MTTSHAARRVALAAAAIIVAAPAGPAKAVTPSIAGTPVLTVAVRHVPAHSVPAAWINFYTARKLDNPRLIVARVHNHSGRTFRGSAGGNCLHSTVVTDDGRIGVTPGHRYRVSFYYRQGIGKSRSKTLIATRTVTARGLAADRRPDPPKCASTSAARATAGPSDSRSLVGKRATVRDAQLLFYRSLNDSYAGSLTHGESFKVRKLSPSGTYAYGFAYGRLDRLGWVKASGLKPGS